MQKTNDARKPLVSDKANPSAPATVRKAAFRRPGEQALGEAARPVRGAPKACRERAG